MTEQNDAVDGLLERVERKTNSIIGQARFLRDNEEAVFSHEPINWADLRCTEVAICASLHGSSDGYIITIEEADPYCPDFTAYVEVELKKQGITAQVRTEW